jgi:hypothetical protein
MHHCFSTDEEVEEWLEGAIANSELMNETGLPGLVCKLPEHIISFLALIFHKV